MPFGAMNYQGLQDWGNTLDKLKTAQLALDQQKADQARTEQVNQYVSGALDEYTKSTAPQQQTAPTQVPSYARPAGFTGPEPTDKTGKEVFGTQAGAPVTYQTPASPEQERQAFNRLTQRLARVGKQGLDVLDKVRQGRAKPDMSLNDDELMLQAIRLKGLGVPDEQNAPLGTVKMKTELTKEINEAKNAGLDAHRERMDDINQQKANTADRREADYAQKVGAASQKPQLVKLGSTNYRLHITHADGDTYTGQIGDKANGFVYNTYQDGDGKFYAVRQMDNGKPRVDWSLASRQPSDKKKGGGSGHFDMKTIKWVDDQPASTGQPTLTPEDQAALEWANKNPNDPNAQQILKFHGR